MSKKRLITLILSIGIFLSLAATVFAAGQPRRYKENSTVKGTISQSFYQVNAKTDVSPANIDFLQSAINVKVISSATGCIISSIQIAIFVNVSIKEIITIISADNICRLEQAV